MPRRRSFVNSKNAHRAAPPPSAPASPPPCRSAMRNWPTSAADTPAISPIASPAPWTVDLLSPDNSDNDGAAAEYVYSYREVYCPLASCHAATTGNNDNSNNSEAKCQCEKYVDLCVLYQKREGRVNELYCGVAAFCAGANDNVARGVCLNGNSDNDNGNNNNNDNSDSDVADGSSTASPSTSPTFAPMMAAVPTMKPVTLSPVVATTVAVEQQEVAAEDDNNSSSSQLKLNASAIIALGISAYIVLACGISVGLWIFGCTN